MEFALVLRELLSRRLLLALGVLVAAAAAIFSIYRVDGGNLKPRSLQYSSASTQLLVDAPSSVLGSIAQPFEPLTEHALVYANFMASPAVLELIGQQVGLQGDQIYAAGPVNANLPRVEQEPTALKRNVEITGETKPYRLNFTSAPNLPTIGVYAQAPTTSQAVALANAAVTGLRLYVTSVERASKTKPSARITIRQLGPANGAVVDSGIKRSLAAIVFLAVLLLWCVLLLVGVRFRENWRASAGLSDRGQAPQHVAGGDSEAPTDPGTAAQPVNLRHDEDQFDMLAADEDGSSVPIQSLR